MKYVGYFKNINEESIKVEIISNNDDSSTMEITLAGESPVIITQTSGDGIFSPIKGRGCTIAMVSHDTHYDMFSASSHGTSVEVINVTRDNDCLFYGYLTPCQYNQPYNYLNEIELEAVDAVSTLKDFKYTYIHGNVSNLIPVKQLVAYIIQGIGHVQGFVYLPDVRLKMNSELITNRQEYMSEAAFLEDDEFMNCYEILEEICKFHNFTIVSHGRDVYILDYETVAKYGIDYSWMSQDDKLIYYQDLTHNSAYKYNDTEKYITIDDYAGDGNNVELDSVYNKISLKATTKEIDEDDTVCDPMDEASSSTYNNTITTDMVRSDGQRWTSTTRLYEFIHSGMGIDSNTRWQTLCNVNSEFALMSYRLTENFTNVQPLQVWGWMEFPYTSGYLLNTFVGQTCMPAQQFNYQATKEMPVSASWNDMLLFFPQAQWINEYYKANSVAYNDSMNDRQYWLNDFYEAHMGGTNPVLKYRGTKNISFTPPYSGSVNYIVITGDILWQQNCRYDDVNYHLWTVDEENHKYGCSLFMIKDAGAHDTHVCSGCSANPGSTGYNTGWPMLKIKLQIGDKYWNGSSWTTTESTFWLNYHKENVVSDTETLIWSDFNKPVTNHNYTDNIGKEGFAIPITYDTNIYGKVNIDIYMPRIPWSNNVIYGSGHYYDPDTHEIIYTGNVRINYQLTPPVIFMKNLSFELINSPSDTEHWYMDFSNVDDEEDDIIYSNTINNNNVEEFDDLELKVNTYNEKEKLSFSYVVENNKYHTEGFYRPHTNNHQRQELNVIDRYVDHYSSPKKIYNCTVHGYIEPWKCVRPTCLDNIRMIVDEQEFDVKANVNDVKLVEY